MKIQSSYIDSVATSSLEYLWCMTDTSFHITHANPLFIKIFSTESSSVFGNLLYDIIGIENTEKFIAAKENFSTSFNKKFSIETKCSDTTDHWYSWEVSAVTDEKEILQNIVIIGRDITTQKKTSSLNSITDSLHTPISESTFRQTEQMLHSVLFNIRNGIFLLDLNYQLILANEQGKRLLGISDFIAGKTDFVEKIPVDRRTAFKKILDEARQDQRFEYEMLYKTTDGKDLWLLINVIPEKNESGKIIGICITSTNITKHKKNEEILRSSEQRWKFALEGAGDGVWEFNFVTKEAYYSPLYKKMLGFSEDEFRNDTYEWKTRVHPDDLESIITIDALYLDNKIENHAIEYRIKNKAGEYIWVLDRGMVMEKTAEGIPLKLIGTHKNITERKKAEEKLVESQQRFASFMDNTPTMTWIVDENAVFRFLNLPYMNAFNLTEDDIGKSIYDIFPSAVCDQFVRNNQKVWENGTALETQEEGIGPGGDIQIYHVFKFPLKSENGVRLLGGVALDITKKVQLEKQLADEASNRKREIIQAIINAQEKERRELAYELHDNVNQILSSSKLMLEVAAEKPEQGKDFVKRSLGYLQDAISEIRKLSHSLTPGTLKDISLEAAIDEIVNNINSSGKLKITYQKTLSNTEYIGHHEIQLSVLRTAQEILNNILKHAEATATTFSLLISPEKIALTIEDNGRGFDTTRTKKGLGLNNIFNRVEHYNGSIKLTSVIGKGTFFFIEIPLAAATA